MRGTLFRMLLVLLLAGGASAARGYSMGPATIVFDLIWTVSTTAGGLGGCSEMRVDAIGDLARSSKFAVYGALNCPDVGSAFAVDGSGYIGVDGSLNVNLRIGIGAVLVCPRLPNLSGTCQLYTTAGQLLGPAQLTFR